MQPTQASTETRLPRAVLRRSQAIADRYNPKPAEPEEPNPAAIVAPADKPADAPATPVEPQATAPAADPRDTDPAYWKQRFSVTEGLLRRERNDRATEATGLHQRVAQLESDLAAAKSATPTSDKPDLAMFFSPAQIEQYGEEQCEVMARTAMTAANTTAQKLIDAAVQPLKDERTRERDGQQKKAANAFTDKLTELYPNWTVADKDERWLGWLDMPNDEGIEPQVLLDNFIRKGDAVGAAELFKKWENSLKPAPVRTPAVAPSGSGAPAGDGAPPTTPEAVLAATAPTSAEVKDFYKRASLGKVKDDERKTFEARLALRNAQTR